jgi:predicted transcriptional regulator of viral defense system
MATSSDRSRAAWALVGAQDDVVTREQLLGLGFTESGIRHRVATGRLHSLWPGVYAVGRRSVSRRGVLRSAVLACDHDRACLSHRTAAELLGLPLTDPRAVHVSVPDRLRRRLPGIRAHRRSNLAPQDVIEIHGIPVTSPATTIVDIAPGLSPAELERAVNDADKLDLIAPESLRAELERMPKRPGKARVRDLLDRHAFLLTDSGLERAFLPLARRAGLPPPVTGAVINGFKVDFFWPDLGLVVETDGLRYHRTPAAQTRDRARDQAHAAAGLTPLRFTHAQVRYEPARVEKTLRAVHRRLSAG